jgi:eukaryotic-like serine/threonine-protein kinase
VLIIPVGELTAEVRNRLAPGAGDYAITRPRARTASKLVSRHVADLVELFRTPTRVVDAVMSYSAAHQLDPRETLDGAFPVIKDCFNARLLVNPGKPESERIEVSVPRGTRIDGWEVVRAVQVLADVELYQVRGANGRAAAMKLLRPGWDARASAMLERESIALAHLNGRASPAPLARGTYEGDPWLAMSWCAGISPLTPAAELRHSSAGRAGLLELCRSIADAYCSLHAAGVVHADVHPGNLLVDPDGKVLLLDFGLARAPGREEWEVPRGAVAHFLDPELAAARLARRASPPATMASDQYALAAVLYLLVTGDHYLDFPLEEEAWLRQVAEAVPLPFTRRGVAPWPELEAILFRALAKDPRERFSSMAELVAALTELEAPAVAAQSAGTASPIDERLTSFLARVTTNGKLFRDGLPLAPTCSVTYGAAGIAYALYRIASRTEDAALLSLADSWITKAAAEMTRPGAFTNPTMGITEALVGHASMYHTASGIHAVEALIGLARGDRRSAHQAVRAFVDASRGDGALLDLTLGRVGTVLGASLLFDALPDRSGTPAESLRTLANGALDTIWQTIDEYLPIGTDTELIALGMAHGWAGILYATLRWCRSSGRVFPASLERRLDELAALAEPTGRGVEWPWPVRDADGAMQMHYMPGWCQGSAGYVVLWSQAHRALGRAEYGALVERAAWNAWESDATVPSLCCGLVGRAYALLTCYRHTGDPRWLARARVLADRAARNTAAGIDRPYAMSLFKGDVGLAVLAADLAAPEAACLPLFEEEGWPSRSASETE